MIRDKKEYQKAKAWAAQATTMLEGFTNYRMRGNIVPPQLDALAVAVNQVIANTLREIKDYEERIKTNQDILDIQNIVDIIMKHGYSDGPPVVHIEEDPLAPPKDPAND